MAPSMAESQVTKYVEAIKMQELPASQPIGENETVFDLPVTVDGWKEIRVWMYVAVDNYASTPITSSAKLILRFMHHTSKTSLDYAQATLPWNGMGSFISGYTIQPVIGKKIRILGSFAGMPPGPYQLMLTYLLVR